MTDESKETQLDKAFVELLTFAREIAGQDCYGYDTNLRDASEPCDCPPCRAGRALESANGWRFETSVEAITRLKFNQRERKMWEAWCKEMTESTPAATDRKLSLILWQEGVTPTPRDWYVATCVVQWLATAIGMSVLEAAGFKYTQFDEDHRVDDAANDIKREAPTVRLRRIERPIRFTDDELKRPEIRATAEAIAARKPAFVVINGRNQMVTTGTKAQLAAFARELAQAIEEIEEV